jgi:hypothetical protein
MSDESLTSSNANNEKWTRVSIRVASQRLTAAEIQTMVGEAPATKAERGDKISQHSPQAGVHNSSWCSYNSPVPSDGPPQAHIEWLTEFIMGHAQAIEALKDDCEFDARMSFSSRSGQGAFTLDGATLSTLGRLGVQLHVDLYPPDA